MTTAAIPDRKTWKRDLAGYLEADERRSLGQIASVVIPYLAVWAVAAIVMPGRLSPSASGWSRRSSWCGCTRSSTT